MSKRKKCFFGCLLAVILAVPVSYGWAVLSDSDGSRANKFKPGSLNTSVSEVYTPITVSLDNLNNKTVSKTVKFKNNGSVPCYIRASVEFSNSDFNAAIQNTANAGNAVTPVGGDWEKGSDGWYYYKKPVEPGKETGILFNRVVFATLNSKYLKNVDSFEIFVSQESVSCFHGGNEFANYSSAWNFHKEARD